MFLFSAPKKLNKNRIIKTDKFLKFSRKPKKSKNFPKTKKNDFCSVYSSRNFVPIHIGKIILVTHWKNFSILEFF